MVLQRRREATVLFGCVSPWPGAACCPAGAYDSFMPPPTRRTFLQAASALLCFGATRSLAGAQTTTPATARTMLTRPIPSTGQPIPVVGMGTWQTFDAATDDAGAMPRLGEVLRLFHAAGGRVVDSSPMYGRSEAVVGHLSKQLDINADLFLATKVWTRGEAAGIEQMRSSLQKLGRDSLELMQIHNLVDWRIHLKTLRAWKEAGTFRYIGITHYQAGAFDEMERILRSEKLDFVQLPYSVNDRGAEKRLLPAARDAGAAVITMEPFDSGNLFRLVRDKPLPDFIRPWAETWAQAFLKWLIANETVTCVIPATSKTQHMRDNVRAGFGPLPTPDDRRRLVTAITA